MRIYTQIGMNIVILFCFLVSSITAVEDEGVPDEAFDPMEFRIGNSTVAEHLDFIALMHQAEGNSYKSVALFGDLVDGYLVELRKLDRSASLDTQSISGALWGGLPDFNFEVTGETPELRMMEYQTIWPVFFAHAQFVRKWGDRATENINKADYLDIPEMDIFTMLLYTDVKEAGHQMRTMTIRVESLIRQLRDHGAFQPLGEKPASESAQVMWANFIALRAIRQEIMMGWTLYMKALVDAYDPDVSLVPIKVPAGTAGPEYSRETMYGLRINSAVLEELSLMQNFIIKQLYYEWHANDRDIDNMEFFQFMRLSDRGRIFDRLSVYKNAIRDRWWPKYFPSREEGWMGIMGTGGPSGQVIGKEDVTEDGPGSKK